MMSFGCKSFSSSLCKEAASTFVFKSNLCKMVTWGHHDPMRALSDDTDKECRAISPSIQFEESSLRLLRNTIPNIRKLRTMTFLKVFISIVGRKESRLAMGRKTTFLDIETLAVRWQVTNTNMAWGKSCGTLGRGQARHQKEVSLWREKKKCQLTFRDLTVDLLGDGLDNERKRRDSWMFTSSMAALLLSKDN